MKLVMLLADGFEDTEAIATYDVLKRGKIDVKLVSLMSKKDVLTKTGHYFRADVLVKDFVFQDYDGLIIPGGPASFQLMPSMEIVSSLIHYFARANKLVSAICAAPFLVGRLGYFKNRQYTVHPGFEKDIKEGLYLKDEGVVICDNFITAKSMYYSISFGLAIYEYFYGREKAVELKNSLMGE